ncbi:MAG: radical SAM protein [Bacteroidales bacterium]|nr:radical SAM protein [Bacteroidales bacterium]
MLNKHVNIPVFIPEQGCKFRCSFCNQHSITTKKQLPEVFEIHELIRSHLQTLSVNTEVQIAFFGGNFCGLEKEEKIKYLQISDYYINSGIIDSVRISTRPDTITMEELIFLKDHHVKNIELGAQSMDDEVLKQSGRGHTAECTRDASRLIRSMGFVLGLQMMIGLPGDTLEKSIQTAHEIVDCMASETRIYPCLVIENTVLASWYQEGLYQAMNLDEAVNTAAVLFGIFESAGVRILKAGLHPSKELNDESALIAGPYHASFRELVETRIWGELLLSEIKTHALLSECIRIYVPRGSINFASGYKGVNRKNLGECVKEIKFYTDENLSGREFRIDYCGK